VNTFPGLVHTARHTTKVGNTRSRWPNLWEGAVEGGICDWGEVVSKLRPSPVTAGEKLGYLLETPQVSRATRLRKQAVKMHRVMRTISREVVVPTLSVGRLTPQRLHAELLETMFERLVKRVNIATL
jgi:hypothetical protein